jgi:4-diphosphocytidyl-2-C-methyl-D-erythritol kinase
MKFAVQKKAYAKINLQLNITGKRDDNYQNIETVMQKVGLCDTVTIRRIESGWGVKCRSADVPSDETNIVFPAGVMFFAMLAVQAGRLSMNDLAAGYLQSSAFDFSALAPSYEIIIDKKIPVKAGLGGGSSDAAATLLALNELMAEDGKPPFNMRGLAEIAKAIGADVPFLLEANAAENSGFAARCSGIGDIIDPISVSIPDYVLLAKGKRGISTSSAYNLFDKVSPEQRYEPFYNVFEYLSENEEVSRIKEAMTAFGASECSLTGSGSAVYGLFSDKNRAEACKVFLHKHKFWTSLTTPC